MSFVGFRLWAVLAVFLSCFANLSRASDASDAASQLAHDAAKAVRKGDLTKAYLLYSHAYSLDPGNPDYGVRMHSLESLAKLDPNPKGKPEIGAEDSGGDDTIDKTIFGELTPQDAADARQPLPPTELTTTALVEDFDLRADARSLYEQVAKAFGLLVVFDSEFTPPATMRFQMQQVDYRTALRALEDATGSFIIPVTDKLIFVAADTPAKRQTLEKNVAMAIPIPETVSTPELNEVVTAVRSTMDIQKVTVDTANRIVLLRDRVSKVRPAQALLESLMRPHPQVELEVDLVSLDGADSLQWGLALPNSFPIVDFGSIAKYVASSIPQGFSHFMAFGGGATFIGIGITEANLFANVSNSLTTTVYKTSLVASQGLPATLHVGDKYPLVTSSFATSGPGTAATLPPPTIQFEDLGFELKITPYIHGTDEVTLDVEANYELLGQVDYNGIPEIDNRKFKSTVRLRNGEWAVVTGLLSRTDATSLAGIAGVAGIPILGKLLSTNTKSDDRTNTLLVIKPRLMYMPPSESTSPTLLTGTETKPISLL